MPSSAGVPPAIANETIVLPFNDLAAVDAAFRADGERIACIIVEPIVGNMNLIMPRPEFLPGLRSICDRHGAVLIFDEVMTGFRVHPGGAQGLYGHRPGLDDPRQGDRRAACRWAPSAAGARSWKRLRRWVRCTRPERFRAIRSPVAAGLATLRAIEAPGFHDRLAAATRSLTDGLAAAARSAGVAFAAQSVGGMFGIYFAASIPDTYDSVMACDKERFNRFFPCAARCRAFISRRRRSRPGS
jgi:glutamate-1-semialdehyde 2,1-aminomutase